MRENRGRESKVIISERSYRRETALLDGQQRSAKVGLLLENPFYEGVRETHLFATTPLSIKQKITCRPGRGWGWGPAPLRRAWRGANGTGQERRHAIFRRVLHKVRPGEVSFHDDTFLRREARRPRQQS